jgi:hypothetical protein
MARPGYAQSTAKMAVPGEVDPRQGLYHDSVPGAHRAGLDPATGALER